MSKDLHQDVCEKSVYAKLYEKHAKHLHDFLYYKYGADLNPRDKAQDAFVKLWENCKKVTPEKARAFLFTVGNNLMLNAVKHRKVVLQYQKIKPSEYSYETPEFIMRKEEFLKKYQMVLANLSEEQRTAFILNKVEGKKHREIAEMLGVTQKVVEYRIYSAFKILRESLDGFSIK